MNRPTPQVRYDLLLRTLHWALAGCVTALVVTSQLADAFEHGPYEDRLWNLHILAGYGLAVTLSIRALWALIGPAQARWRALWQPHVWKAMLFGHRRAGVERTRRDPLASLAYVAAYAVMGMMVATGLALAATQFHTGPLSVWIGGAEWLEPVLEEPHEAGFALMLGFVGLHLAALVFHRLRGEDVASRMLKGGERQRGVRDAAHD